MSKVIQYIKRKTKGMTPSERFLWVEKEIFNPLRLESIKYVNGQPLPISDEVDTIGEAVLYKGVEVKDGAYAD